MPDDYKPPADQVVEAFEAAREELQLHPNRKGQVIDLPAEGSAVFSGDLHDNRTNWRKLKHVARVADDSSRHLLLHELIHGDHFDDEGREDSWRMLFEAVELFLDFPEQVHFVLANHDLAQIHGEGISKGGLSVCEAFTGALKRDFGGDKGRVEVAIVEFLLALPLGVRMGGAGLFFCHSVPGEEELDTFDYDVFARETLGGPDYRRKVGPAYQLIWGRGAGPDRAAEFADAVGADIVITGHQPQASGYKRNGDRHLILASDHTRGVCLELPLDKKLDMDAIESRIQPFVAIDDSGEG
ncbi:MAG: metallophosphoesterase [Planctomycetota bacterium]